MFSNFMGDIFEQLLSKEMFYEPMKELNEKVDDDQVFIISSYSRGDVY
jgi:hypothetical protein